MMPRPAPATGRLAIRARLKLMRRGGADNGPGARFAGCLCVLARGDRLCAVGGGRGPLRRPAQYRLRRPLHVRASEVHDGAGRVLVWRLAGVGTRPSAVGTEPHADHERGQLPQSAYRRNQYARARRSGSVQVPDRVHHRARLVGDDRPRSGRVTRVSAEGRLRDRRRFQAAAFSRRLRRRLRHRAGTSSNRR